MEQLPDWLVILFPVLGVIITQIVKRYQPAADFGPRNLSAVVALVLAPLALWALGLEVPDFPAYTGSVTGFLGAIQVYGASLWAIWLAFWKLQQLVYDGINGQISTPD